MPTSHPDVDDLAEGIQPFCTVWLNMAELTTTQRQALTYDDLYRGPGAQLSDLQTLKATEKVKFPMMITQITYTIKAFTVLVATILGAGHALTWSYHQFPTR